MCQYGIERSSRIQKVQEVQLFQAIAIGIVSHLVIAEILIGSFSM